MVVERATRKMKTRTVAVCFCCWSCQSSRVRVTEEEGTVTDSADGGAIRSLSLIVD